MTVRQQVEDRGRSGMPSSADEKRQMIEIAAVYERLADHYGTRPSAEAQRPPGTTY
jgi:hypothetical protein